MSTISTDLDKMLQQDEHLIAVDSNNTPLYPVEKRLAHTNQGTLHRAFTVFLFNSAGETLLTQRSLQKPLWPEWWDGACSSHPWWPQETEVDAAVRRLPFELGLTLNSHSSLINVGKYEYHAVYSPEWSENEINSVIIGVQNNDPLPNEQEVMSWKWLPQAAVDALIVDVESQLAPWFKQAWIMAKKGVPQLKLTSEASH